MTSTPAEPPRVVGIDDWAWRKGQRYGTIVVDLERSDVIDLRPDRDADTVAAWLRAHPGIEVVSRDRSATYAQAATEGASRAVQVADRWHLLKNLREAVERVLERHSAVIGAALKPIETPTEPPPDADTPETGAPPSPVEPATLNHRANRARNRRGYRRSSRSVRSASTDSSKSISCTSGATQPLGSPGNRVFRGGLCSATCSVRCAQLGASGDRAGPGWTGIGGGSTRASPRA
jgi:Transposase